MLDAKLLNEPLILFVCNFYFFSHICLSDCIFLVLKLAKVSAIRPATASHNCPIFMASREVAKASTIAETSKYHSYCCSALTSASAPFCAGYRYCRLSIRRHLSVHRLSHVAVTGVIALKKPPMYRSLKMTINREY
jgi:hypothetical protein